MNRNLERPFHCAVKVTTEPALIVRSTWLEGIKCFFSVGPFDCSTAKKDAQTAAQEAEYHYPATIHNGVGDAYRHCLWNALMTLHIGADQAKTVADNHEDLGEGPAHEKQMDLKNNLIGREIGTKATSEAAARIKCADGLYNGQLEVNP
ncbi:unnamed protein product [Didymodactylos carnosus]|uniref:DUF6973 domain-containing protein n=1 Tax=Didymodactylos carnosus TaxID=1234261 RepID=A0A814SLH3_9BILA|nr:unnamed protein product [Didymodactylos carnosus]CAF1149813.1 unnamed protein product [Didymodactylos carnosus]CAF3759957.1 unnamed protein product [Didymodactylos carnosus]CAF3913357.1 unnamed protein product [Didymodactylos carnosus]